MARLNKKAKAYGFSLVELLIVVAIIGVLSTIGVPTFRRMVTKAKKTEAKTSLGGLFTVESAFFTEYNTYGNVVDRIGFELEGTARLYTIGFAKADCTDDTVAPTLISPEGTALNLVYKNYYTSAVTQFPRSAAATVCFIGPGAVGVGKAGITATGDGFYAVATGHIAPGTNGGGPVAIPAAALSQDVWSVNNKRLIVNEVDGTN